MHRIVARLDIKNDYVIKGIQYEGLRRLGCPKEFATKYYQQKADEILFYDQVASLYKREAMYDVIKFASENCFVPITVCGGIRTLKDISMMLKCGADKVAINTQGHKDPKFLSDAVNEFGSQCIVAAIDAKNINNHWEVYIENARINTGIKLDEWVDFIEDIDLGEIVVSSIDRDGMCHGLDIDMIELLTKRTNKPIIVGGGACAIDNIKTALRVDDQLGILLGSSLHYGKLVIPSLKKSLSHTGFGVRI